MVKKLPKGCELCFKGEKSVLFITGICPRNCIYCPLSEEKKNNDIIYINELKTMNIPKILNEIKLSNSKGIGITGGDPLSVLSRTIKIIKKCKKAFGKKFHIHLYTSLILINENVLSKLQKSGLDELRVHPDIYDSSEWDKIKLLKNSGFKEVGIEIPSVPNEEKRISDLIEFSKNYVDFYNLNQLEYATLHEEDYKKKKWKINEDYSVKGSDKTALEIIKKFPKLRIHYCSSKFKDITQFTNRIKLRAKNTAEKFDTITDEGLLMRAEIIPKNISLKKLHNLLKKKFKSYFKTDKKNKRILFSVNLAKRVSELFPNVSVVEEYPTIDGLQVTKNSLS